MAHKNTKTKSGPGGSFREEALSPALLERILRDVHKPLKLDDFLRVLALPRRQKKALEGYLAELASSGRVIRLGGGGHALASALKTFSGVLAMQRSGVGFVRLDAPGKGEVFIAHQHLGGAWHGDRVEVAVFPGRHGKNQDGRITHVLERGVKELPARVVRLLKDGTILCEPMDARITAMFLTDVGALESVPPKHSLLRIRPEKAEGPELWTATALALLGDENDTAAKEELVKANHAIPRSFPPAALREAAAFPCDPGPESLAGRKDLSRLPFVTIDGASARDFDDAVCVETTRNGHTLFVAIADVAHYVRPKSGLDDEALLRGNSYYFPRSVEPMLPEALSNGLCSLNPGVPRLVMVAEMAFSAKGKPVKETFYPAVIVSSARLTYDQVRDALILGKEETRRDLAASLPMLEQAMALARILADERTGRGSLDFELPEPECVFDGDGNLVNLVPRETHFAHKLIEEFMVAANEAVARFLTAREVPLLYRVHPAPDPDKLRNLFHVLAATGLLPPSMAGSAGRNAPPPSPKQLQAILTGAKGTPHEYLISRVALRSMMQAGYSQDLDGHFGLASDCYCHFTSPIRRYADLVVHRSLKAALDSPDKTRLPGRKSLQSIADHINATERTAMEAEREIYRRLGVLFMSDHVGETFTGVISGLTEFGIFVEIGETMTEGMVRLAELNDDYYVHYPERQQLRGERTGRIYHLGQAVAVTVMDVSPARLEINLAFAREVSEPDGPRRMKKQAGPEKRKKSNNGRRRK
ncbi:Ribonuclease R (fragment) [uncultured delta proteobacterium]|uniref:Ribonuclease R n=1 Tax=uncultured delta proteobacterium TaxID=34034 RepID=A0A212KBM1_9DELT